MNAKEFRKPGTPFRGKPFWAWNGKMEPEELRRQVRIFHRMGLGGGFMHSRVGLATEYLGREWFACVKATIDECRKLGLEAWLYDEDRWPSGAAGGLVTKNKKYRMRKLHAEILDKAPPTTKGLLRVFRGTWADLRFRPDPDGKNFITFAVKLDEPSPWYNGQTYLDTMSKEAVREFIRKGYAPYAKEVGEHFGSVVPGIFTDEPNYGHGGKAWKAIAWTDILPAEFKKRYGYDVLDWLPALFYEMDDPKAVRARVHYRDLVTALFVENFSGQIGKWCGEHNLLFTGHVLAEETLESQTKVVGAAMRFYEHMQAPGIDILTEARWGLGYEYDTAKQCESVRRQMGRKWMLSELYGCTGWDFTFEGHKAIGDWQAALGVNLRCQHLSWYTMLGQAKRDYPAAIFFQSPWWKEYPVVEDYFARVNYALVQGEAVRDVLVIHPIESQWALPPVLTEQAKQTAAELQRRFTGVRDILLQHQIDFDYGDEEMLSRLAKVTGQRLRVGKASYKAVVVPPALTLRRSTLKLLAAFARTGGKVLFVEPVAGLVDALPSDAAQNAADGCRRVSLAAEPLVAALAAERTVLLKDGDGNPVRPAVVMMRQAGARTILFVCNTDREQGFDTVRVTLRKGGVIEEWNPQTGEVFLVAKKADSFVTSLPASGSRLFVVGGTPTAGARPRPSLRALRTRRLPQRPASITLTDANAVVLDMPRFRVGDGEWNEGMEILKVDRAVRTALGVAPRGGAMVQPWARPKPKQVKSVPVELEYTIRVRNVPQGPVDLALETPERFDVRLNGSRLTTNEDGAWWVDPCLQKLPVPPGLLVPGENTLSLRIDYTEDDGLETCFLLGRFGVQLAGNRPEIVEPPATLEPGDWCGQGLPFYTGSVAYRLPARFKARKRERLVLRFDSHRSSLIRVSCGGKLAGYAAWPPYEVDVTDVLDGKSDLCIEVFGSRRNAFGPLHLVDPNPVWTGPEAFVSEGDRWRDEYHLKPCGLVTWPLLVTYKS